MDKATKKIIDKQIEVLMGNILTYKDTVIGRGLAEADFLVEKKAFVCKTVFYGYLEALKDLKVITREESNEAMTTAVTKFNSTYFDPMA